jgi:hypothetical protein
MSALRMVVLFSPESAKEFGTYKQQFADGIAIGFCA